MKSSVWNVTHLILSRIKKFPLFKLLYRVSWAPKAYHFSLALFGSLLYRFPGRKLCVIGITGTKGKTTTVELVNAILEMEGKKTALLSSLRVKLGEKSEKNTLGNSMPGHFFIQNFLKQAEQETCTHAIIEVTSQGIALSRHRFIPWTVAALTNLAPEHIEAHGSFEKYRDAKRSFLNYAARRGAHVFLNIYDARYEFFKEKLKEARTFSRDIFKEKPIKNDLIKGDFYKDNMALAFQIGRLLGVSDERIYQAFNAFKGIPGRMDFIQREPFIAVVDYAHTPDSLRSIYETIQNEYIKKKAGLIGVLGSAGGGRDKWKRPAMGEIAGKYCSCIVLTNEDPYDEDPLEIIRAVRSGISKDFPQNNIYEILDRKEAIRKAVSLAKSGDAIVFSGKGSESFIHMAHGETIPWNEREMVEEVLKEKRAQRLEWGS